MIEIVIQVHRKRVQRINKNKLRMPYETDNKVVRPKGFFVTCRLEAVSRLAKEYVYFLKFSMNSNGDNNSPVLIRSLLASAFKIVRVERCW